MIKRARAWSDGCAARVRGRQIDFLRVDSSGIVAALGKRGNKRYVRGTWPNGPKKQEEMEAQHWGDGTDASLCEVSLELAVSSQSFKVLYLLKLTVLGFTGCITIYIYMVCGESAVFSFVLNLHSLVLRPLRGSTTPFSHLKELTMGHVLASSCLYRGNIIIHLNLCFWPVNQCKSNTHSSLLCFGSPPTPDM